MINWKLMVSVLVIVAICIVSYLFFTSKKTSPTTTTTSTSTGFGTPAQYIPIPNQSASPIVFVTSFYTWYLQGIMGNQKFVISNLFKSSRDAWFVRDFADSWTTIAENTGGDPALLAQDYRSSWVTNINAIILSQTATTSSVLMSLGSPTELHKIIAHLVSREGTWRISAVTQAP